MPSAVTTPVLGLTGVPSAVTTPVLGPIDSRLQDWRLLAVDCRTVDCRIV